MVFGEASDSIGSRLSRKMTPRKSAPSNLNDSPAAELGDVLFPEQLGDYDVSIALANAVSESQKKDIAEALIRLAEPNRRCIDLIKTFVYSEVTATPLDGEGVLFRTNSMSSKLLSSYINLHALPYLRNVLGPVLKNFSDPKVGAIEVNPILANDAGKLKANMDKLLNACQMFLSALIGSVNQVPLTYRYVLKVLSGVVAERFPRSRLTVIGGFTFLRIICPVIITPVSFNLLKAIPSPEIRRGLVFVSKVLQNTANGILYGDKEQFMIGANDFITNNQVVIRNWFESLIDVPDPIPINVLPIVEISMAERTASSFTICSHISTQWNPIVESWMSGKDPLDRQIRKGKLGALKIIVEKTVGSTLSTPWENSDKNRENNDANLSASRLSLLSSTGKASEIEEITSEKNNTLEREKKSGFKSTLKLSLWKKAEKTPKPDKDRGKEKEKEKDSFSPREVEKKRAVTVAITPLNRERSVLEDKKYQRKSTIARMRDVFFGKGRAKSYVPPNSTSGAPKWLKDTEANNNNNNSNNNNNTLSSSAYTVPSPPEVVPSVRKSRSQTELLRLDTPSKRKSVSKRYSVQARSMAIPPQPPTSKLVPSSRSDPRLILFPGDLPIPEWGEYTLRGDDPVEDAISSLSPSSSSSRIHYEINQDITRSPSPLRRNGYRPSTNKSDRLHKSDGMEKKREKRHDREKKKTNGNLSSTKSMSSSSLVSEGVNSSSSYRR